MGSLHRYFHFIEISTVDHAGDFIYLIVIIQEFLLRRAVHIGKAEVHHIVVAEYAKLHLVATQEGHAVPLFFHLIDNTRKGIGIEQAITEIGITVLLGLPTGYVYLATTRYEVRARKQDEKKSI